MDNKQLDPQVVNLAKAIRQTESGGNWSAKGKSGEYGAYQFTPETWSESSKKYLGQEIPLEKATPQQQNEVVYKRIKEWKDSGKNVGQIASMWNAGEGEPDAYTGKFSNGQPSVGKNKKGVSFDVPSYANSVASAYQNLKRGVTPVSTTNNPSYVNMNTQAPELLSTEQITSDGKKGLVKSALGTLDKIVSPFVDIASIPVQGLAKAIGVEDPYSQYKGLSGENQKISQVSDLKGKAISGAKVAGTVISAGLAGKGAGLIRGALLLKNPVTNPVTSEIMKDVGIKNWAKLSTADKFNAATEALTKVDPASKTIVESVLTKLGPQLLKEKGIGSMKTFHPAIMKTLGLTGEAIKYLISYLGIKSLIQK